MNYFYVVARSILVFILCMGWRNTLALGQDYPSDVPYNEPTGRILTGPNLSPATVELVTSLGLAVGTAERSETSAFASLSTNGRIYYAFRGIPFAKPPVGPLRWADPEPLTGPWEGSRLDATRFRNFCPQYDHDKKSVVGSEDCLYLNVYTPILSDLGNTRSPKLPVMIFIHGGAYTRGAPSSHGPSKLLREDIVVVTISYRLGVLGLLSSDDYELAGNYGALDQIAAMKWVRRHIIEFGGNPDAVTLCGFSAGASYVHMHLLSPLSEGLFQKAIIMSGSANCLWSVQPEPWYVAKQLGQDLECSTLTTSSLKQCLLLKDAESLIEAQTKRTRFVYWPFEYRPVVDLHNREHPFLPASIEELHRNKLSASNVPVLLGSTPEEGILFALTVMLYSDVSNSPRTVYDRSSSYIFESLWPNITNAFHMSEALRSFYFSDNAKKNLDSLLAETTDALTDLLFTSCIWDAASELASFQAPVYTYLMTHHDEGSPSFGLPLYRLASAAGVKSPLLRRGVSHGDDIILIFDFPYELGSYSERDQQMSIILTSMISSFVSSGNPQNQSPLMSQFLPWRPIQPGEPVDYYRLSLNPMMIDKPYRHKERNYWRQTLPIIEETYNEAYEGWIYKITFWTLFVLLVLLIIIAIVLGCCLRKARRSKSYPESGATLRSQLRRPPSMLQS